MITVFGLGFVGLTTALGFAHKGIKVYGIDVDENRAQTIKKGTLPFFEPDMGDILKSEINNTLYITDNIQEAVENSSYIFYCVGTPCSDDKSADLKYLYKAVEDTLENIKDDKFRTLIIKSTVPPTTTSEKIVPFIQKLNQNSKSNVGIVNNPEFLREGYCWSDFMNADRIVIGCNDDKSEEAMKELYKIFEAPIFIVSHNTGEFIKYLSNTMLATMVSFSNEMAIIGEQIGNIDIKDAFKTIHMDKRWNENTMKNYIYPGCGYGGYCLPKDTNAMYEQSKLKGYDPLILKNVIKVNEMMPQHIARKITRNIGKDKKIGILGLSFKPDSDDVRFASSAKIIQKLIEDGYTNIYAYDPISIDNFKNCYDFDINYCSSMKELYDKSEVMAIVTAWNEFKEVSKLGDKTVIDCRYMV